MVNPADLNEIFSQKLGNRPGIKLFTKNGLFHRFCGFNESDLKKLASFCQSNFNMEIQKQELSVKGWNFGETIIKGQNLVLEIDSKLGFEVPLSNVSRCVGGKSEATMEFHINEDCPIQLMEMRLHIPQDLDKNEDVDIVEVCTFFFFFLF